MRGDAYVAWHEEPDGPIRGRIVRSGGTRGPIETLSSPSEHFDDVRVALNDGRQALVAWRRFDGSETALYARRREPGGSWGERIELREPGGYAFFWGVGMDEAGTATAVWQQAGGLVARRIGPAGQMGETLELAPDTSCCGGIATSAGGRTVVVWSRFTHTQVQVSGRGIAPDGRLEDVVDLTEDGDGAENPEVFAAPDGGAFVLWGRWDAEYRAGGDGRAWGADGSLGAVERIGSDSGHTSLQAPDLAFNSSGDAYIVWSDRDGFHGRVRRSDGALGDPHLLDPNGGRPEVGLDDAGNAVIAWTAEGIGVHARSRLADGRLSPPYSVSRNYDLLPIFAGMSRDGRSVIVWPSSVLWDESTYIQGAYFDALAPFGIERPGGAPEPAPPGPGDEAGRSPESPALQRAVQASAARLARRMRVVGRHRLAARGRVRARLHAPTAGTYTTRIDASRPAAGSRPVVGRARFRFEQPGSRRVAVPIRGHAVPRRVVVRVAFVASSGRRAAVDRRVFLRP
jgi:hypothetical protein